MTDGQTDNGQTNRQTDGQNYDTKDRPRICSRGKKQSLQLLGCLYTGDKMANGLLKQVFQEVHSKIASSVNPDSIMDVLFAKKVIGSDDYYRLRQVSVTRDRCRDFLSLLHTSSHPQAFVRLRLALLHDYSWIVDEIDTLLTSQLQQLHLSHSTDGKRLQCELIINVTLLKLNPLKPSVIARLHFEFSAPSRPNLPFLISDIRALWRSAPSARMPECRKLKMAS